MRKEAVYFDLDDGFNAVENCRLEPREINNKYWQQCEQIALPQNDSGMRHAADLIWRQLQRLTELHKLSSVVFVIPSHYQKENLQLLVGIAQSCGLKVEGIVNKAVLSVACQANILEPVLHIDVQLHQIVCSEVLFDQGELKLGRVEVLHEIGLSGIQDRLLREIQARFIHSDRFDPLHYAETEQQLFNQLEPLAVQVNETGKANVMVVHAERQHGTSIDLRQWKDACSKFETQLAEGIAQFAGLRIVTDYNGSSLIHSEHQLEATSKIYQQMRKLAEASLTDQLVYQTSFNPIAVSKPSDANQQMGEKERPALTRSAAQNGAESLPLYALKEGHALPLSIANVAFESGQIVCTEGEANIANLIKTQQLIVLNDPGRDQLSVNDRLGSDLADGVITLISVGQNPN